MENFILCTVWNKDDRYLKCKLLREQISNVNEFNFTEETHEKTKKMKNWTAPGMDGIQNLWWNWFKQY